MSTLGVPSLSVSIWARTALARAALLARMTRCLFAPRPRLAVRRSRRGQGQGEGADVDRLAAELADAVNQTRIEIAGVRVGAAVSVGATYVDASCADPDAALAAWLRAHALLAGDGYAHAMFNYWADILRMTDNVKGRLTAEAYTGKKGEFVPVKDTIDCCEAIIDGKADDRDERDLYLIGKL